MILFNMKRFLSPTTACFNIYLFVFINVYYHIPVWHVKCSMMIKRAEDI